MDQYGGNVFGTFSEYYNKGEKALNDAVNPHMGFLENPWVTGLLTTVLIVYGARINLPIPDFIRKLFKNDVFRVVFLMLLLVFKAEASPSLALLIALVFLVIMGAINNLEVRENFQYIEAYKNSVARSKKQNNKIYFQ